MTRDTVATESPVSCAICLMEIPVFWCCGVTPQSVVMSAKPPIAISHAPGHMFITDVKNSLLKD